MNKMYFRFIALFLLLLPMCAARGQSQVSHIPANESDTSIVRYWENDISIVYTFDKGSEFMDKYFLLADESAPTVRRIAVPQDVTVNDFRILHDSVFIVGHTMWMGSPLGLFACFDIQDFYNGSGYYRWMVTLQSDMYDCGNDPLLGGGYCVNQIYDVTRLAVYDSSGCTKMAYIAKNYVNCPPDSRIGIGSASFVGGAWSNIIMYNKHAKEDYTDIIATQDYVVAVARNNVDSLLAMRIFPKSNFLTPLWSTPPPLVPAYPYYSNPAGQRFWDLKVDDAVMATALEKDSFAVAYHYTDSPKEGLAVKTFDISGGVATFRQGLDVPVVRQPGSKWKMRDISYSPALQRLMVLHDFDGGTLGSQTSIVYQFPLSIPLAGTYQGLYPPNYDFHALNLFGISKDAFIASGNITSHGPLTLYREVLTTSLSCGVPDFINGVKSATTFDTPNMATNMNVPVRFPGNTSFVVEEVGRDLLCDK